MQPNDDDSSKLGQEYAAAMDGARGMTAVHERRDHEVAPLRLWLGSVGPCMEQVVSLFQYRYGWVDHTR
jgi:hypothetical protein